MMTSLFQDARYALRMSMRAPGFTFVAVLALALGIGANTAIFTIVHAVLIERLPYQDPGRLAVVWETNARRPGIPNVISPANYLRWQERATTFDQMSAFYEWRANLTGTSEPEEIIAQDVTANFFSTLGVAPIIGRGFLPDEGPDGRNDVTVLSYRLWQRRFGGDRSVIGRIVQLNSRPCTVIGIMPPDVTFFVKAGSLVGKPPELWTPFAFTEAHRRPRGRYMMAIGRLKPSVSFLEAQTQMSTIASALTAEFPQFDTGWGVKLVPIHDELSGEWRPALFVLSGAVAFVLLIACANVANLLLARGAARRREVAIRSALGAARLRVIRQLLTESLVLAILGGALGILIARWGLHLLIAMSPIELPALARVQISSPVLVFTAVVSFLTTIVFGLAPAFESSRADGHESLKSGQREGVAGIRQRRLRDAFVVAEIALAVVLLVGSGLMLRSLQGLRRVNPGFDSHDVLTVRVSLPFATYPRDEQRLRFFQDLVARVSAIPGVRSAGAITALPFAGLGAATGFTIVGQPPPANGQGPVVDVRVCDNGYFRTMGVPLMRGRLFTDRELRERSNVVIINETMALRYFPQVDPIGKSVAIEMMSPVVPTEIIGVVGDVRHVDLITPARAMSYWPHVQLPSYSAMTLTIRTAGEPDAFGPRVLGVIHDIDRDQPAADIRTMDQWLARSLSQARFSSLLLTVFAALALLLASIGIYGVMAYAVSQRTSEIGIRLALGAEGRDILSMIVGTAMKLAAAGIGIGVLLALALGRTLSALLYQTPGTDPFTFGAVVVVLGIVAIVASYLPARRASHITPVEALRCQ
jgi:putative ABC transport system permease protein